MRAGAHGPTPQCRLAREHRAPMRLLFAALFLIGLGLVGYAQLAENLPRTPIGNWPVYAPVERIYGLRCKAPAG